MIKLNELVSPDDRLNMILDKISKLGFKKLNKDEIMFLDSYSIGKEYEVNKKISEEESSNTFISDDGHFTFILESVEYIDDIQYITGSISVPDMKLKNGKIIEGKLEGTIIVFCDGNLAIDFRTSKYEIFEFVDGIEYELDCFIDDIVSKINDKNEY